MDLSATAAMVPKKLCYLLRKLFFAHESFFMSTAPCNLLPQASIGSDRRVITLI